MITSNHDADLIGSPRKRLSSRALRRVAMVSAMAALSLPVASSSGVASAYTPQNCGNQTISTASQSTSLHFYSQFTSGCGMKAAIKCRYSNGTGDTGLRLSSLIRLGQAKSVYCPSGKVGYYWGHQEGVNW